MRVSVCFGSVCNLKGARQILERLRALIVQNNLQDKVLLGPSGCMRRHCNFGVCVMVNGKVTVVTADTVDTFFEEKIKANC